MCKGFPRIMINTHNVIKIYEKVGIVFHPIISTHLFLYPKMVVRYAWFPPQVSHALGKVVPESNTSVFETIKSSHNNGTLTTAGSKFHPNTVQIFSEMGAIKYAFSISAIFALRSFDATKVRAVHTDSHDMSLV
jgi:hypothetical protein